MHDLHLCQQDDPYLFCFLLPLVLSEELLPTFMINNSELVYLIVSCIDSRQLKDLVSSIISQDMTLLQLPNSVLKKKSTTKGKKKSKNSIITSGKSVVNTKKRKRKNSYGNENKAGTRKASTLSQLKISKSKKTNQKFRKETMVDVLNTSLQWDTIEQIFFWEILLAHDGINLDYLLPIFNRLDPNKNAEAICYLFQLIKSSEPSFELVKYIVQRRNEDNLARALLINWCKRDSAKMIQIFIKLLNKTAAGAHYQNSGGSGSATFSSSQQQQQAQAGKLDQSTVKKITLATSGNNKAVKLTAQQQLEQVEKQKRLNAQHQSALNGSMVLIDDEDLKKMPTIEQVIKSRITF